MTWKSFESHRDAAMQDFAQLPVLLHAGDPWHVPVPADRLVRQFDPSWNPYFGYGTSRQFVAYRDGTPAVRCTAGVNPRMDRDGMKAGTIGFFESENDPGLACALVERALGWLRDQHVTRVYGPVDFSIWWRYRFKTGGFDQEPYFAELSNRPYYGDLFEAAGFAPCGTWYSEEVDVGTEGDMIHRKQAKLATRLAATRNAGHRIVPISSRQLNATLMRELYEIILESYAGFLGFYPLPWEEFLAIYGDLRRILRRKQLLLAYHGAQLSGALIQYWDWAPLMRACQGRPGWREALRLRFAPHPGRWIVSTLGISPASMRDRSGLGSALIHEGVRTAMDQKASRIIYSLMGEFNRSRSVSCGSPARRRTYTLYQIDP